MTVSFRHLDHYVRASFVVLRQEMVSEAKEHDMFNPEDVDHFVSAVVPPAVLSAINAYPISLVSETFRAQESHFQEFRRSFNTHTQRLQDLVMKDIALASAGRIPIRRSNRAMNKTRMDQIELAVSSIASAAIDASKNKIEDSDTVLSIVLDAILQEANEYTNCIWIAKETIHLLHALVIEEFEMNGLQVSFDGEKITQKMKNCIWVYNPDLAYHVCDSTRTIRSSFELTLQPISRVVFISEKTFLVNVT